MSDDPVRWLVEVLTYARSIVDPISGETIPMITTDHLGGVMSPEEMQRERELKRQRQAARDAEYAAAHPVQPAEEPIKRFKNSIRFGRKQQLEEDYTPAREWNMSAFRLRSWSTG